MSRTNTEGPEPDGPERGASELAHVGLPDAETPRSVVRQAIGRFLVWGTVAMVLVALGSVLVSDHIAREEALRDARQRGAAIARGIAAPLVDEQLRAGDPEQLAVLEQMLRSRIRSGSLSHVKIWAPDGTIIWADDPDLVGERFELEEDVRSLFGTTEVTSELSSLEKAENVNERDEGRLLEVYVGTFDSDNNPIVFEAYLSTEQMADDREAIIAGLLPLSLSGLLVFALMIFPLSVSLARRVDRAQLERAKLLRHALAASDLERRRIAQDLHDGVIQDLAGLGYAIPIVRDNLHDGPEAEDAREAVDHIEAVLGRDVTALRSLLTDIYPPDLEGEGLIGAVEELALQAEEAADLRVVVHVAPGFEVPLDATRLAYRVVREGLRNVMRHARASKAQVQLQRHGDEVIVRVVDDGRGPGARPKVTSGHLGLRLLEDTIRDLGGRLELSPGAAGGAVLEAVFPARLAAG